MWPLSPLEIVAAEKDWNLHDRHDSYLDSHEIYTMLHHFKKRK